MLKKFRITVDGKPYSVTVEDMADEHSHLYPAGGDMAVAAPAPVAAVAAPAPAPAAAPAAAKPAAGGGAGDVISPLGGVLVEVKAGAGASVNAGDIVAVIEAMKMKTNVFADNSGTVSAVHVKVGDAVDSGQAIMTIN